MFKLNVVAHNVVDLGITPGFIFFNLTVPWVQQGGRLVGAHTKKD